MIQSRFEQAVAALSAVSAADPNQEMVNGVSRPRELVQTERLVAWIARLSPEASEALRLAAFSQHVGRYRVPRSTYPEGRVGYLRWRTDLAKRHAATARAVLTQVGYDEATIAAVERINLKRNLRLDADVQTMEDALCLSFLEHELAPFASEHEPEKTIAILQKTWRKMSPRARELALTLELPALARDLVARALARGAESDSEG
ncbi:MAG TPA: DUF4202 domain-containing protein [Polyangiaceae bacterium]|nr:DUF4202 domain-containing protein [Polyangiaceae bacterium]